MLDPGFFEGRTRIHPIPHHPEHFFILDGCSFNYARMWSKSGISTCLRHLVTSKELTNPIFFSEKIYVRNMF